MRPTSCTRDPPRASSPPSSAPPTCSSPAARPTASGWAHTIMAAPERTRRRARARGGRGGAPGGGGGRRHARGARLALPGATGSSRRWCSPARSSACACASPRRAGAPLLSSDEGNASTTLQVTRTQHEQRDFEVRAGQQVAIGVRRLHVLPTPLSSFTACAPSAALAESLSRQPLLAELAARMKTRIGARIEPELGVAEAPCQTQDGVRRHHRASPRSPTARCAPSGCCGAARTNCWCCRRRAGAPQRVLIHWTDDAARSATLGVSASVLRHVSAEAVYVGIFAADGDGEPSARHARAARCALGSAGGARPGDAHRAALRRRRAASWRAAWPNRRRRC